MDGWPRGGRAAADPAFSVALAEFEEPEGNVM